MTASPPFIFYHNPACSTSRSALALLRESGREAIVVDYLKTGWREDQLLRLSSWLGGLTAMLRRREPDAAGLQDASESELLKAMLSNPRLVERPILEGPAGAVIARPADRITAFLAKPSISP